MHIKNKVFCCLMIAVLAVAVNIGYPEASALYQNANGVQMTSEEYSTLINLGFTQDEIYHMDRDTFEANKDLDATLLTREVKYYKTVYPAYGNSYSVEVTEEEYNNPQQNMTLGSLVTEYKTVISSISANGNKYRYKISVAWNRMPAVKKYDIIGIGYGDQVSIYNSIVYFTYHYTTLSSSYSSTQYYDEKVTQIGATKVYKIPENITGLSATLYYDVVKNTTNTLTSLEMCADYSHATSNSVTSTIAANHNIGSTGIGLHSNVSLYDEIPCTYANAAVNW